MRSQFGKLLTLDPSTCIGRLVDRGARAAQPVALLVRPRDRRPLHRRRRPERDRGDRLHPALERRASRTTAGTSTRARAHRGDAARHRQARLPGRRVRPRPGLQRHRRVRVPRLSARSRARPVRLRRLLQRNRVELPDRVGRSARRASGAVPGREPELVRRGRGGRAVRSLPRRDDLPDRASRAARTRGGACPSAAYASAFSDSCSCAQLAGDEREALLPLGRAVQPLELVRDPVETLEQRVELAVSDVALVHDPILRALPGGRPGFGRRSRRRRSPRAADRAHPSPVSSVDTRRAAPSCASAVRASSSGASVKTPSVAPSAASACSASARRRVAAEERRRAILAEPLEQDAPVADAPTASSCRGGLARSSGSPPGSTSSTPRADSSQSFHSAPRVPEGVELDRDRA